MKPNHRCPKCDKRGKTQYEVDGVRYCKKHYNKADKKVDK